jgi:hypothetical protein
MRKCIFILFHFVGTLLPAQNLVANPDFEYYSTCPTSVGQATRALAWYNVIQSADYYNCNFTFHLTFPTVASAYSGSGYVAFGTHFGQTGNAECIGQTLPQPLLPGSYFLSFAAKKANAGGWSSSCGGVNVYGLKETSLPISTVSAHASQFPNALLLGASDTVGNNSWQVFSVNFSITDTIKHVLFTLAFVPGCSQYIFIDSIQLVQTQATAVREQSPLDRLLIFPNPTSGELRLQGLDMNSIERIRLINLVGQELPIQITKPDKKSIRISDIPPGIFLLNITDRSGHTISRRIIGRE